MGILTRSLAYLGAAVIAVMLVAWGFPEYGIDFAYRGHPFRFQYVNVDGQSFRLMPYMLDTVIFLLPVALVCWIVERKLQRRGVLARQLEAGRLSIILAATILLFWLAASIMLDQSCYFRWN